MYNIFNMYAYMQRGYYIRLSVFNGVPSAFKNNASFETAINLHARKRISFVKRYTRKSLRLFFFYPLLLGWRSGALKAVHMHDAG